LLESIVVNPDQPVASLRLLNETEEHQQLIAWNDTEAGYPKGFVLQELFQAQVERTPEASAVEVDGKRLSYRELNTRANQLAQYLRGLGVGPEKLVGVCIERSLEMVIGLLGILKAGGAYVPLDPAYPRERLAFMLQDAQVSVLLTQERLAEDRRWRMEDRDSRSSIPSPSLRVSLDPPLKVVCVDRDWKEIAKESEGNVASNLTAENLAYVIYTSGSTGIPKGVQISHRSLVNCVWSMQQQFGLTQEERWVALTTLSFDIAGLEIYLPLITGALLVLASREEALDGKLLAGRLTESGATVMQVTPSGWKLLLDGGWRGRVGFKILSGGEALSRELADRLLDGGTSLWNLYGPTETTIWSTITKVEAGEGPVSLGRPISNSQIYILDSRLQPVPLGVHGELYIGGEGLARGYLNRPELTSERFVPNPFGNDHETRLYRTGDRACYRADGNIEFLGRTDNQVKIRGYRIELAEIEAALNQHPAIKESVVITRDRDSSGEKDLIGYFVPTEAASVPITGLRNFLRGKVPAYMVPSLFVQLEGLPLSPNGKIDRIALRSPDDTRPELKEAYVEPRTQVEELLAQIWVEVLQIEEVGIHDNFFELGGHSLLAIQIISRVREAFDKDVPLSALFDTPTVAGLAATIEKTISGRSHDLPPIVRAPRDGPLPLSMNQEHLWRLDQMIPGTHFFNMPYVYRLGGELNVDALEKALREIIRRHEALRTVFEEIDGRPVQIIKDGSDFQLQTVDFRGRLPDDASRAAAEQIVEERWAPFDLVTGPLRRVKLLWLTEKDALLLITMHHIISDHWSMQVFRGELVELYRAIMQGCPSSLPEPKIQFGDYALWERQLLDSGRFNDRARYWKNQVMTDRGESQFRAATEGDSGIVHEFHRQTIDINASLLSKIKHFAVQQNCTPFTVVLSAVFVMSYLIFGEPEILCGTLMSNRRSRESEGIIGHFLNTVVIRARLSPADTFERIVKRVRVVSLAGHANQEFPFEQLRRELEKENKFGRVSSIRVLFNYQKRAFRPIYAAGLKFASWSLPIRVVDSETLPAAYDLIFDIKETSTALTGAVNVVEGIYKQRGARNANIDVQEVLNIMVSEPSKSLLDVWTITD